MDCATINTIISTSGAVVVGVAGMYINSSRLGKRLDDVRADLRDLKAGLRDLRNEFYTFKDVVNSKFAALDLEITKLMDRPNNG